MCMLLPAWQLAHLFCSWSININTQQNFKCEVCLFVVCLTGRSAQCGDTMGPDGTRLEQNAQTRLKSLYKHAGQLVYGNVKRERETETDLNLQDEGKEDHGHSQQIKLNNFNISLWDKRKEILYPISTAKLMWSYVERTLFLLSMFMLCMFWLFVLQPLTKTPTFISF